MCYAAFSLLLTSKYFLSSLVISCITHGIFIIVLCICKYIEISDGLPLVFQGLAQLHYGQMTWFAWVPAFRSVLTSLQFNIWAIVLMYFLWAWEEVHPRVIENCVFPVFTVPYSNYISKCLYYYWVWVLLVCPLLREASLLNSVFN